jgi:hypothetical protein
VIGNGAIHREFRLFVAPPRVIRCADKSPRDRVSVADVPQARHVLRLVPALGRRSRVDPEFAVAFA